MFTVILKIMRFFSSLNIFSISFDFSEIEFSESDLMAAWNYWNDDAADCTICDNRHEAHDSLPCITISPKTADQCQ